jgi:hypothetical protein
VRLDSASAALGAQSSVEELTAGAEAIAAGATPDALRAVRSATRRPSVSVALRARAPSARRGGGVTGR